jgi:hypothetical protein
VTRDPHLPAVEHSADGGGVHRQFVAPGWSTRIAPVRIARRPARTGAGRHIAPHASYGKYGTEIFVDEETEAGDADGLKARWTT